VKAFQFAYGIANDADGDADGLPRNPIARLLFIKTAQGYLTGIPRAVQQNMVFNFGKLNRNSCWFAEKVASVLHLGHFFRWPAFAAFVRRLTRFVKRCYSFVSAGVGSRQDVQLAK
jgi:hypothetical protein